MTRTDLRAVEIVASSPGTTTGGDGGILGQLGYLQFDWSASQSIQLKLLGRGLARVYLQGGVGNWGHFGQVENKICKIICNLIKDNFTFV